MNRVFARRVLVSTVLSGSVALAVPGLALASAVKIGSTIASASCCGPGNNYIQQSTASTSPKYTVPTGGTKITSFSVMGNATTGVKVRLVVYRLTSAAAGTYKVVGQSLAKALTPSVLNTAPVTILVHPGDTLGMSSLTTSTHAPILSGTAPEGDVLNAAYGTPTNGSPFTFPPAHQSPGGFRLNISAIVQLLPVVTSISPTSGHGGTTKVTITGLHLTGTTTVLFGTAKGTSVHVVDDQHVTAVAPTGVAPGTTVNVRVATAGGASAVTAGDKFKFL